MSDRAQTDAGGTASVTSIKQAKDGRNPKSTGGQWRRQPPIVSSTGGTSGGGSGLEARVNTLESQVGNLWKVLAGSAVVVLGAFGGVLLWGDAKFDRVDDKFGDVHLQFGRVDDRFNEVNQTLMLISGQLSQIQTNQSWIINDLRSEKPEAAPEE